MKRYLEYAQDRKGKGRERKGNEWKRRDMYVKSTEGQEKTEISYVLRLKKLFLKTVERGLMEQILED